MNWIREEVGNGLQALVSLRLKNTPAADMIELTADIWVQAFMKELGRYAIEELDAPRIREGFRARFGTLREWPAPVDILEKMPPRPKAKELPEPEPTEEQHRENVAKVKAMVNDFYMMKDHACIRVNPQNPRHPRSIAVEEKGGPHGLD